MTVTKQQQLEWLVNKITKWPEDMGVISVSVDNLGNPGFREHWNREWIDFTFEEWQQERDKMQKQSAQQVQSAQPAPDNSWHDRGELPPLPAEDRRDESSVAGRFRQSHQRHAALCA